ncbi:hypothetical protein HYX07_00165 [Candidatus Woesearchaeota archaeon]|nr:hypothetical protein [Candidatus Woesearchaeota archaeon]
MRDWIFIKFLPQLSQKPKVIYSTNLKIYYWLRLGDNIKLSKHDRYVLELKDRIKNNYDSMSINVPLRHSKRSFGEIDIIAQKGNRFDLYEVKCSFRIMKAKKQLDRLKKYLKLENSGSYFYCGNSKSLVTV